MPLPKSTRHRVEHRHIGGIPLEQAGTPATCQMSMQWIPDSGGGGMLDSVIISSGAKTEQISGANTEKLWRKDRETRRQSGADEGNSAFAPELYQSNSAFAPVALTSCQISCRTQVALYTVLDWFGRCFGRHFGNIVLPNNLAKFNLDPDYVEFFEHDPGFDGREIIW
ncbi:hypothetical protein B0H17DRAFT_1137982 [Mycena rosella]|uniref:Uncharacterized protein n=1 Tax=Mycena rosella TaxID=1033263 RepID=A0AAD7GAC4_MYCRO|nr:hypothetical protein B0H17DRAFT_1137982 [Mycena rosella]